MQLHGIHHITAITADAQANVGFYSGLLGLRFVKRTVNFDDPTAYHLYYGDHEGSPGSLLTFFEYPGVPRGRAGDGMIHRIVWRVADEQALDFWEARLSAAGIRALRHDRRLTLEDPEGLGLEFALRETDEPPLVARSPEIPERHALQGFDGVRAYASQPPHSDVALGETLGFARAERMWRVADGRRTASYTYDAAPEARPSQGAGTVHHIAWAVRDEEQVEWRRRVLDAGLHATPVIDRTYFRSVYFREPSGVLFELATMGPGMAVDEPLEHLGEQLRLPPQHEHLRARLQLMLTPLQVPFEERAA
jgi:glyoxalase family protein